MKRFIQTIIVLLIIGTIIITMLQINGAVLEKHPNPNKDTSEFSFRILGESSKIDLVWYENNDNFIINDWPLFQKVKSRVKYYPRDSAICWGNEAHIIDSIMVPVGVGSFSFNSEKYLYIFHENWFYDCSIDCFTHLSLFKITADSLVEVLPIGYQAFDTIACIDDFNGDGRLDLLQYCYNDTAWFSTLDSITNRFIKDKQYYLILFREEDQSIFKIDRKKSKWFSSL